MKGWIAIAVLALTSSVAAQPARNDAVRARFYANTSAGVAILDDGELRAAVHIHASLGLAVGRDGGLVGRLGPTVEAFPLGSTKQSQLGGGLELQLDHPVNPCWRAGARIAAGQMLDEQHSMWMIGARVRSDTVSLGIDAFTFRAKYEDEPDTTGVLVTAGLVGRHAKYGILIEAVGALAAFAILAASMGGSH
jgi:hypothetical protein